jgi:glycosyltransferase involved in cell wall biosynthesis
MKILFITHDASQSGAPLMLLYLMRWLKEKHPNYHLDILFVRGGVMEPLFKEVTANQYYIKPKKEKSSFKRELFNRVKGKFLHNNKSLSSDSIYKKLSSNSYHLIYSNTVVTAKYGSEVKQLSPKAKHLVHVHELQTIITTLTPEFPKLVPLIDVFIAASHQVKENLMINQKVQENKVEVVYECAIVHSDKRKIKKDNFIVGACGLSYWRKGNDIFLQVARFITKKYPDIEIKYFWVGNEYKDKPIIDADIKKLGLEKKLFFVGEVADPAKYFNSFDVFLLPSREDPFPLVCIEQAHLKTPIICFEKASGTAEVITKGGGFVVPYLDIEAMAEKVVHYYNNPKLKIKDGEKAFELFKDFTPNKICPQIHNIMNKITD